ncbi:MAG: NAD(P)-binding domain-containing protein [Calditrichaceae bacterium]
METIFIYTITLVVGLAIFLPYYLRFRKTQKKDLYRKKEAVRLGADKPVAQYPQIDQWQCIGCGSCVAACPEGSVLGIVGGKATIINGLKCVGHGLCEEACPVGAIKVGLGDIKSRDDIPVMTEFNETNIEGLYIAGELGGLALIRNAINQGRKVAEHIASKVNHPGQDASTHDLIIVGAGPAGLSAALTAKKHNLSFLVIDQQGAGGTILHYPRKKLVMTKPVELPMYGWLKHPEYTKEELLDIWEEIETKFDLNLHIKEKLEHIEKNGSGFKIKTSGNNYRSRYVILALGRRGTPRKLNIPGENLPKVMYKLIDAEAYTKENLLVIGGGDSAIEAAIGLARQEGNTVTLSYRKDKFFRIKKRNEERIQQMTESGKINVKFNSEITRIDETTVIIKEGGKETEISNSYVFIFAGGEPPFKLMKQIGIKFGGEMKEPV